MKAQPKGGDTRRTSTDRLKAIPAALKNFPHLPDDALVKQPVVEALFSISPTTVWRWVNSKRLPMPRRVGVRSIAWNVGELRKILKGNQHES